MPKTILIVDDVPELRKFLALHVQSRGYRALTAGDGREAVEILLREHVAVVITDLEMPAMDGLALLEFIRQRAYITRSIVITGHTTLGNLTSCFQEGAVACLPKPVNTTRLDRAIDQAFEQVDDWVRQIQDIRQQADS